MHSDLKFVGEGWGRGVQGVVDTGLVIPRNSESLGLSPSHEARRTLPLQGGCGPGDARLPNQFPGQLWSAKGS